MENREVLFSEASVYNIFHITTFTTTWRIFVLNLRCSLIPPISTWFTEIGASWEVWGCLKYPLQRIPQIKYKPSPVTLHLIPYWQQDFESWVFENLSLFFCLRSKVNPLFDKQVICVNNLMLLFCDWYQYILICTFPRGTPIGCLNYNSHTSTWWAWT